MHTKILVAVLATAALALAAPALASAATGTPAPNLPAGVHPACIANSNGECEHATITLSGNLTTTGPLTMSCRNDMTITFYADGTSDVTAWTGGQCAVAGFPGCVVHTTATNLDWGDRLGYSTSDDTFRDYINVDVDTTFTPGCPAPGTVTLSGIISPEITIAGGRMHAAFAGASSGSLSSVFGSQTVTGTLTSTSGVSEDTQLIPSLP